MEKITPSMPWSYLYYSSNPGKKRLPDLIKAFSRRKTATVPSLFAVGGLGTSKLQKMRKPGPKP
jgi:hypothetical protein